MYIASNAFHDAVANNAPQKALLVFSDAIFTNDDIDVDSGIEMDDYFNTEEDIAIGQALSNELRFTLFNDRRLLNEYEFGEFLATIGARISTEAYTQQGNVTVYNGLAIWSGYDTSPYLKLNGRAVNGQPNFAVKSIAIYDGKVYVFGSQAGQFAAYTTSGTPVDLALNDFMKAKGTTWPGEGINYDAPNRMLYIYKNGVKETYEFVPLGYFIAKRPNVPDVNQIVFTCHDRMTKFDTDMPDKNALGIVYPITISELFVKMCAYAGVEYSSSVFINSSAVITTEPQEFANATMRQVIQWIAEAAASNARFNRSGRLQLSWLNETNQVMDESNYVECNPCWYETTQVDKLYNRNSESGTDKTVGTGDIGYLIQDNPLLKGVT